MAETHLNCKASLQGVSSSLGRLDAIVFTCGLKLAQIATIVGSE